MHHPERAPTDHVGERYGKLEVLSTVPRPPRAPGTRPPHVHVRVRCDCGAEKTVQYGNLRQGLTTSCGCVARRYHATRTAAARTRLDAVVGARYGTLAVVALLPAARLAETRVRLRCDCGAEVTIKRTSLRPTTRCRRCHPPNAKYVLVIDGVRRAATRVAAAHGVSHQLYYVRLALGWSELAAATTPPDGRLRRAPETP